MKKILLIIVFVILLSCKKENTESYKVNNDEYVIKSDSINLQVINKDTLKFYFLKNKLRSIKINYFSEPEDGIAEEKPFFFKYIYCINKNNEFDAIITELNNVKTIGVFRENSEYNLSDGKWQKRGAIENYFYDFELMNLDIALTRINNYNFPKSLITIPNDSLVDLVFNQEKKIFFYDIKSLERIENRSAESISFKYLRDIKIIKRGKVQLILARIVEEESGDEFYINLRDITRNINIRS